MYINFDEKIVQVNAVTYSFDEALAEGVVTQKELDDAEMRFLTMALIDIEDAGYQDVTTEANKQNKSNHWCVFANEKGVHYCDTIDDVIDLVDTIS